MIVHRPHPIDDDPPEAVLYDNCPRCDQHAATLTGLDSDRLAWLATHRNDDGAARTTNEAIAMAWIGWATSVVSRLPAGVSR